MAQLSRRSFFLTLPAMLAACTSSGYVPPPSPQQIANRTIRRYPLPPPDIRAMYGQLNDDGRMVPAVDLTLIDPAFLRHEVSYYGPEDPGTVVVDTDRHYLYYVEEDGLAIRYGIGVGREGFGWSGVATIARKARWPSWHPPVEMQARDPKARKWAGGMPGGPDNPLGARAHYLYQDGRDTLYRIHGTAEPWTIGTNVSSGCIRMINQDVIDLFDRVPSGTTVEVLAGSPPRSGLFGALAFR
jgi:lipoprotein-anchoring transpeptidase ErfK/SrfK